MNVTQKIRAAIVPACLSLGILGAFVGCASTDKDGHNTLTAPQAWKSMEDKAMGGSVLNAVGIGEPKKVWDDERKRANEEVTAAMKSPLPVTALDAMVDDMAQNMADKLPNVPEVKDSKNQLILAIAPIQTPGATDNVRLRQALDSLAHKLFENEKIKDSFVLVNSSEGDADKLNQKLAGGDTSAFRDPLQRTEDKTHAVVYDPDSIFIINGDLSSVPDVANHSTTITLSLTFNHVRSRRTIEQKSFERTYMWHPYNHNWELQK